MRVNATGTYVAEIDDFSISATETTMPFLEEFSDNFAQDFTLGSGYSVSGEALHVNHPSSAAEVNLSNADGVDLIVSATVKAAAGTDSDDIGFLVFADSTAASPANGYLLDFKQTGATRIYEAVGGAWTLLTTSASNFTFSSTETYVITARATPNGTKLNLTFTVNDPSSGPVVVSATSIADARTGDYFGMRVNATGTYVAEIDDFSISAVPVPPTGTVLLIR
jgi:hypothetical protein